MTSPVPAPVGPFTVIFSDEQRVALLAVLSAAHQGGVSDPGPLQYWQAMLEALPADEAENPGIHHGFCL
jgi:hypothetical protein